MKNLIILTFLIVGFLAKAQQQELFDEDWYVTMITVDGEEFLTPNSDTHSMPPHDEITIEYFTDFFGESGFSTNGCNSFFIDMEGLNNSSFTVLGISTTLMDCMYPLYDAHDGKYYFFFGGGPNEEFPLAGFEYEIINNSDNTKTLIITNPNGDKVYYNNSLLSTFEISNSNKANFQLAFQNDDLIIKSSESVAKSVSVYNFTGKLVLKSVVENDKVLTNNLPKEIYIVKITNEKGSIYSKKVRKN